MNNFPYMTKTVVLHKETVKELSEMLNLTMHGGLLLAYISGTETWAQITVAAIPEKFGKEIISIIRPILKKAKKTD